MIMASQPWAALNWKLGCVVQSLNLDGRDISLRIVQNTLLIVMGIGILIRVIGGFLGWF